MKTAEPSPQRTILCLFCRNKFTLAEIEGAKCCPSCGSAGIPADCRKAHTLTLTDQEWRVLFLWADFWAEAQRNDPDVHMHMRAVVSGIRRKANRQQPTLPPLTLVDEVQDMASTLNLRATITTGSGEEITVTPGTKH